MRSFHACKSRVFNRGTPPDSFLDEMVDWAINAPDELFTVNDKQDIYSKIRPELGVWQSLNHRKAAMLEVMRVLAGFESSWNWNEGVDTSRAGGDTSENSEAGAWQVSYDARRIVPELRKLLEAKKIQNGVAFQRAMKFDHPLAMEFVARLMRYNTRHNGPLYKGTERKSIRPSLRGEEHSIYPWLKREAVAEFQRFL